jgi:hypothetical protein
MVCADCVNLSAAMRTVDGNAPFGASPPLLVRVILSEPDATFRGSYVVVRIFSFVTATRMHCIARTMEIVIPGRSGVHSRASQQVAWTSEAKSGVGLAANPGLRFDATGPTRRR